MTIHPGSCREDRIRLTGVSKIARNRPLKGRFLVSTGGFVIFSKMSFFESLELGNEIKAVFVPAVAVRF